MTEEARENYGVYNEDRQGVLPPPAGGGEEGGAGSREHGQEPSAAPAALQPDVIREALKAVVDPEIGLDIVNLGLIYGVDVHDNNIKVEMTLTGPGCPIGPMLQSQVYGVCASMPGARNVQVDLVWTPPWDPRTMASEEAKDLLGIW